MHIEKNFLRQLYTENINQGIQKFISVDIIADKCNIYDVDVVNKILMFLESNHYLQIINTPIKTIQITELGINFLKEDTLSINKNPSSNKEDLKVKILLFASNPGNEDSHLELDREVRDIEERIRLSDFRDGFDLKSCWAVRPRDLLQKINEQNPDIIHFSGHGSDGSIYLQDDEASFKEITCETLLALFKSLNASVRLVVFNNCHSNTCASKVVSVVDAAIGMSDSIGDEAAIHFAAQLYSSIGFGLSIEKSFEQAKTQILLEGINEASTPQLHGNTGIIFQK